MSLATIALQLLSLLPCAPQDTGAGEPGAPAAEPGRTEIEITFLANEGFLLRTEDKKVLIDAFVAEPSSIYEAVQPDVMRKLVEGQPPFDGNKILALTSHAHRDHFQPGPAEQYLRNNPGAAFFSSSQVINVLLNGAEDPKKIKGLCGNIDIKPGQSRTIPHPEMRVQFMNLPHGGEKNRRMQNYGHLITMGGLTVLHVGDADMREELFTPYDLASKNITVAFVPYWYFTSEEGIKIIEEHFKAEYLIACHFPIKEKRKLAELLTKDNPHVLVFDKAGDKKVFRSSRQAQEE